MGERHTLYFYMEHGKKSSHRQRTQRHLGLEKLHLSVVGRKGGRETEPKKALVVSSRGRWCRRGCRKNLLLGLREAQRDKGEGSAL